jgi:16S rRNA (uracil1498-N3)-methyltransferase
MAALRKGSFTIRKPHLPAPCPDPPSSALNGRSGLLERAASVAQFVVLSLDALELSDDDTHHLTRVLRVRNGEHVIATDGAGSWRRCVWNGSTLQPDGEVGHEDEPSVPISIGFSLLKGDRNELVVQKLTELGVDEIVPVVAVNCVTRWDENKTARNLERLRRIAHEAAMQSRRVWMPRVSDVISALDAFDGGMCAAHPGGDVVTLDRPRVVVGPEGGFSSDELVRSPHVIDLGPTVLRAETASITLGALLCARRAN